MPKNKTNEEAIIEQNADKLTAHADSILDKILEKANGCVEIKYLKKRSIKINGGETEEEVEDITDNSDLCEHCGRSDKPGKKAWLYTQPSDGALLRYAYDHIAGRAAQKAQQSFPITINVVHQVPGWENLINAPAVEPTDLDAPYEVVELDEPEKEVKPENVFESPNAIDNIGF